MSLQTIETFKSSALFFSSSLLYIYYQQKQLKKRDSICSTNERAPLGDSFPITLRTKPKRFVRDFFAIEPLIIEKVSQNLQPYDFLSSISNIFYKNIIRAIVLDLFRPILLFANQVGKIVDIT